MQLLQLLIAIGACLFAVAPLGLALSDIYVPAYVPLACNFVGWTIVCVLYLNQRRMSASIERGLEQLGERNKSGDFYTKLQRLVDDTGRYLRAEYALEFEDGALKHPDQKGERLDVGASLRKIARLTYTELRAQAVELALYDQSSNQWSQAFILGTPQSATSQSMLMDASAERKPEWSRFASTEEGNILSQPIQFAGTMFGILRIELAKDYVPTESDRKVAKLLARQGALALIDARFNDELLKLRRNSEESVRAKTGFLANLSHEIRGPLAIILNAVELMLEKLCGPLTAQQIETCQMIQKSAEHLLDLVNDVLDYAKLEAGKVQVKPAAVSVKDLLSDLANVVRSQSLAKKQTLTVQPVDPTTGIVCDKRHARQMVINFLTNAIKYTPEGGSVNVGISILPNQKLKIWVQDTGVGIPENQKQKVFTAFERVEHEYSLAQVGTGLGMPLTKKLAEANGGTADFESLEGKGSTFWITLPSVEMELVAKQEVDERAEPREPQGHGETILLIDRDQEARQMLERYLTHQGFATTCATSGVEVMAALRDGTVRLAVIDNDLPEMSGEDMISVIRGNPKARGVPLILLSSRAFVFDIERFLKLGVDRCLSKPIPLGEIAVTARKLIDESKALAAEKNN